MIRLINATDVKNNTTIEKNVDNAIIAPFIFKVQDIHLQQALGTAFYLDILDKYDNGTLNADELNLVNTYIKPMLIEWVYYEVYPHISYKPTNKSISKERSEYSDPSDLSGIKYMRDAIRNMAEYYTQRLNRHLCDYSSLFPLYLNPGPKQNVKARSKSYFSGVYTGKSGITNRINRLFGDDEGCC
jgi:hypothetical protein